MVTVADILCEARATISDPERWTQGAGARDSDGDRVPASSRHATCWCASGAIARFERAYDIRKVRLARSTLASVIDPQHGGIEIWNDSIDRTHEEVLAAFDHAIELAGLANPIWTRIAEALADYEKGKEV